MRYLAYILVIVMAKPVIGQEDAKVIFTKAIDQVQIYDLDLSLDVKNTDDKNRIKEKSFGILMTKFGDIEKIMMIMEKPERASGITIVLTKSPEEIGTIEVYTPANGKIRKMKATPDNINMVGLDFSFSGFNSRSMDDIDFTLIGTEEIENKPCYKIEATEKDKGAENRIVFLVEKSSSNISQIIVYDENGDQKSISNLSDFQPVEGIDKSLPRMIYTEDLENKKYTEIKVREITPRFGLKEDEFKIQATGTEG